MTFGMEGSFAAVIIISSKEDAGILKLCGYHLTFCAILVCPIF